MKFSKQTKTLMTMAAIIGLALPCSLCRASDDTEANLQQGTELEQTTVDQELPVFEFSQDGEFPQRGGPGAPPEDGQGPAPQHGHHPPMHRPAPSAVMMALDVDRDGQLSADEIAAAVSVLLTLDEDGDGMLSCDELKPAPPAEQPEETMSFAEKLMDFDYDASGEVTEDELPCHMKKLIKKADTDGSGGISETEAEAIKPPGPRPRGGGGGGGGGGDENVEAIEQDVETEEATGES